ncbi:fikk kinase [Cystoisospora suis]|uniref:non-specific serine/threonine protein kinase n=1 Tax=Cystoisospora suis TaxID=483139 RepID=A0A2C6L8J3_9APIC|nr:fikk kinase [Cystoisospora suis]
MQPAGLSRGAASGRPEPPEAAVQSSVRSNLSFPRYTVSPADYTRDPSSGSAATVGLPHHFPAPILYKSGGQPPGGSSFVVGGSSRGSTPFLSVPHITVNICPNGSQTTVTRTGESSVSLSVGGASDAVPPCAGPVQGSPLVSVSIIGVATPASDVPLLPPPSFDWVPTSGAQPAQSHLGGSSERQAYPIVIGGAKTSPPCPPSPLPDVLDTASPFLLTSSQRPRGGPHSDDRATAEFLGGQPPGFNHRSIAPPAPHSTSSRLSLVAPSKFPTTSLSDGHVFPGHWYSGGERALFPARPLYARCPSAEFPRPADTISVAQTPGARRRALSVPSRGGSSPTLARPELSQSIASPAPARLGDSVLVHRDDVFPAGIASAHATGGCRGPFAVKADIRQSSSLGGQIHAGSSVPSCQLFVGEENDVSFSWPTSSPVPRSGTPVTFVGGPDFPVGSLEGGHLNAHLTHKSAAVPALYSMDARRRGNSAELCGHAWCSRRHGSSPLWSVQCRTNLPGNHASSSQVTGARRRSCSCPCPSFPVSEHPVRETPEGLPGVSSSSAFANFSPDHRGACSVDSVQPLNTVTFSVDGNRGAGTPICSALKDEALQVMGSSVIHALDSRLGSRCTTGTSQESRAACAGEIGYASSVRGSPAHIVTSCNAPLQTAAAFSHSASSDPWRDSTTAECFSCRPHGSVKNFVPSRRVASFPSRGVYGGIPSASVTPGIQRRRPAYDLSARGAPDYLCAAGDHPPLYRQPQPMLPCHHALVTPVAVADRSKGRAGEESSLGFRPAESLAIPGETRGRVKSPRSCTAAATALAQRDQHKQPGIFRAAPLPYLGLISDHTSECSHCGARSRSEPPCVYSEWARYGRAGDTTERIFLAPEGFPVSLDGPSPALPHGHASSVDRPAVSPRICTAAGGSHAAVNEPYPAAGDLSGLESSADPRMIPLRGNAGVLTEPGDQHLLRQTGNYEGLERTDTPACSPRRVETDERTAGFHRLPDAGCIPTTANYAGDGHADQATAFLRQSEAFYSPHIGPVTEPEPPAEVAPPTGNLRSMVSCDRLCPDEPVQLHAGVNHVTRSLVAHDVGNRVNRRHQQPGVHAETFLEHSGTALCPREAPLSRPVAHFGESSGPSGASGEGGRTADAKPDATLIPLSLTAFAAPGAAWASAVRREHAKRAANATPGSPRINPQSSEGMRHSSCCSAQPPHSPSVCGNKAAPGGNQELDFSDAPLGFVPSGTTAAAARERRPLEQTAPSDGGSLVSIGRQGHTPAAELDLSTSPLSFGVDRSPHGKVDIVTTGASPEPVASYLTHPRSGPHFGSSSTTSYSPGTASAPRGHGTAGMSPRSSSVVCTGDRHGTSLVGNGMSGAVASDVVPDGRRGSRTKYDPSSSGAQDSVEYSPIHSRSAVSTSDAPVPGTGTAIDSFRDSGPSTTKEGDTRCFSPRDSFFVSASGSHSLAGTDFLASASSECGSGTTTDTLSKTQASYCQAQGVLSSTGNSLQTLASPPALARSALPSLLVPGNHQAKTSDSTGFGLSTTWEESMPSALAPATSCSPRPASPSPRRLSAQGPTVMSPRPPTSLSPSCSASENQSEGVSKMDKALPYPDTLDVDKDSLMLSGNSFASRAAAAAATSPGATSVWKSSVHGAFPGNDFQYSPRASGDGDSGVLSSSHSTDGTSLLASIETSWHRDLRSSRSASLPDQTNEGSLPTSNTSAEGLVGEGHSGLSSPINHQQREPSFSLEAREAQDTLVTGGLGADESVLGHSSVGLSDVSLQRAAQTEELFLPRTSSQARAETRRRSSPSPASNLTPSAIPDTDRFSWATPPSPATPVHSIVGATPRTRPCPSARSPHSPQVSPRPERLTDPSPASHPAVSEPDTPVSTGQQQQQGEKQQSVQGRLLLSSPRGTPASPKTFDASPGTASSLAVASRSVPHELPVASPGTACHLQTSSPLSRDAGPAEIRRGSPTAPASTLSSLSLKENQSLSAGVASPSRGRSPVCFQLDDPGETPGSPAVNERASVAFSAASPRVAFGALGSPAAPRTDCELYMLRSPMSGLSGSRADGSPFSSSTRRPRPSSPTFFSRRSGSPGSSVASFAASAREGASSPFSLLRPPQASSPRTHQSRLGPPSPQPGNPSAWTPFRANLFSPGSAFQTTPVPYSPIDAISPFNGSHAVRVKSPEAAAALARSGAMSPLSGVRHAVLGGSPVTSARASLYRTGSTSPHASSEVRGSPAVLPPLFGSSPSRGSPATSILTSRRADRSPASAVGCSSGLDPACSPPQRSPFFPSTGTSSVPTTVHSPFDTGRQEAGSPAVTKATHQASSPHAGLRSPRAFLEHAHSSPVRACSRSVSPSAAEAGAIAASRAAQLQSVEALNAAERASVTALESVSPRALEVPERPSTPMASRSPLGRHTTFGTSLPAGSPAHRWPVSPSSRGAPAAQAPDSSEIMAPVLSSPAAQAPGFSSSSPSQSLIMPACPKPMPAAGSSPFQSVLPSLLSPMHVPPLSPASGSGRSPAASALAKVDVSPAPHSIPLSHGQASSRVSRSPHTNQLSTHLDGTPRSLALPVSSGRPVSPVSTAVGPLFTAPGPGHPASVSPGAASPLRVSSRSPVAAAAASGLPPESSAAVLARFPTLLGVPSPASPGVAISPALGTRQNAIAAAACARAEAAAAAAAAAAQRAAAAASLSVSPRALDASKRAAELAAIASAAAKKCAAASPRIVAASERAAAAAAAAAAISRFAGSSKDATEARRRAIPVAAAAAAVAAARQRAAGLSGGTIAEGMNLAQRDSHNEGKYVVGRTGLNLEGLTPPVSVISGVAAAAAAAARLRAAGALAGQGVQRNHEFGGERGGAAETGGHTPGFSRQTEGIANVDFYNSGKLSAAAAAAAAAGAAAARGARGLPFVFPNGRPDRLGLSEDAGSPGPRAAKPVAAAVAAVRAGSPERILGPADADAISTSPYAPGYQDNLNPDLTSQHRHRPTVTPFLASQERQQPFLDGPDEFPTNTVSSVAAPESPEQGVLRGVPAPAGQRPSPCLEDTRPLPIGSESEKGLVSSTWEQRGEGEFVSESEGAYEKLSAIRERHWRSSRDVAPGVGSEVAVSYSESWQPAMTQGSMDAEEAMPATLPSQRGSSAVARFAHAGGGDDIPRPIWALCRELILRRIFEASTYSLDGVPFDRWRLQAVPTMGASITATRCQRMWKGRLPSGRAVFIKRIPASVWEYQWRATQRFKGYFMTDGENFVGEAAASSFLTDCGPPCAAPLLAILHERSAEAGATPSRHVGNSDGTWGARRRYVLVSQVFGQGDLLDFFDSADAEVFTAESKRSLQYSVVQILLSLHTAGIAHLDLTPENILVHTYTSSVPSQTGHSSSSASTRSQTRHLVSSTTPSAKLSGGSARRVQLKVCDLAKAVPLFNSSPFRLPTCVLRAHFPSEDFSQKNSDGPSSPFLSCEPTVAKGPYMPPECWRIVYILRALGVTAPFTQIGEPLITTGRPPPPLYLRDPPAELPVSSLAPVDVAGAVDAAELFFDVRKADVYMLGVLLFWIWAEGAVWTCSDPKQDTQYNDLVQSGLNFSIFADCDGWAPELLHLLKRALEPEPSQRATLDEILQHPWWSRNLADVAAPSG